MTNIKKIKTNTEGKSESTNKTNAELAKKGKGAVAGCPELMPT